MNINIDYAIITEKGTREINEDAVGVCNNHQSMCFILCDGLGGHGMGDIASSTVISVFKEEFEKNDNIFDFLNQSFMKAQNKLLSEQKIIKAQHKMKTTAVVLAIGKKCAHIGYIGDSRAYFFKKDKLIKRTLDHSIPQMLALSHEINESEIRNHPDRNMLLRVMGVDWEEPMYELMKPISIKKHQAFLLCSDGFWELIEEEDMRFYLKNANSSKDWLESMTKKVIQNGKGKNMDNYSAIAIRIV